MRLVTMVALRLVDASAGHASGGPLDDSGDAVRVQLRFQIGGNLCCHSFLNLDPLGINIYDPSDH
jgi:hypothetical protein